MRILLISRYLPFTGGRENFVYELIKELVKENEVGLVTPDGLIANGFRAYQYKDNL